LFCFVEDDTDPSKYSIALTTTIGNVTLKIKLVEEYPMTVPDIDIISSSHKLVVHDLLKALQLEVFILNSSSSPILIFL